MPYDLFISYARADDRPPAGASEGRVTQLVAQISHDFAGYAHADRPLRVFFDQTEIHGMDDWRARLLQGLRESHLLLACLSPAYLDRPYCAWELTEYLKHEVARHTAGQGVAPIYFVPIPGWDDRDFDARCEAWVAELRRRQAVDLRPWFTQGSAALQESTVRERLSSLAGRIHERIARGERSAASPGNVDAANPHFVGRVTEMRRLREAVALGQLGVVTAVHGLGGMGKTALAIEYAHAFADEYGGGRWQARCEGQADLSVVLASLAGPLAITFSEDERADTALQAARVLAELQRRAEAAPSVPRCLLLLDNVDQPALLAPAQTRLLPAANWLHVLATSRLGAPDLHGVQGRREFVSVDELPDADALALIERYQPDGQFRSAAEREAAAEIVTLLGRFTLAVETAAVYLGQYAADITCAGFLARLRAEGLTGLEAASADPAVAVQHGEARLSATLEPTLERLSAVERSALALSALLPADQVALPWIRAVLAESHPEVGQDADPGYPDPWRTLERRLVSQRLWQPTDVTDDDGHPRVVRVHRLVGELIRRRADLTEENQEERLTAHIKGRARFMWDAWVHLAHRWELEPLTACAQQWLDRSNEDSALLATLVAGPLRELARYTEAEPLYRRALAIHEASLGTDHPDVATSLNNLAGLLAATNRRAEAEPLYRRAIEILERSIHGTGYEHPNLAQVRKNLERLQPAERLNTMTKWLLAVTILGVAVWGTGAIGFLLRWLGLD